jgi:predicted DNA-binding protein with PD1-like motif
MNVRESRKSRHLVIRLDRGDELPAALVRALDEAEARSAFIQGVGALEAAEVAVYDQASRAYGKTRRVDGGCEVITLSGNVAAMEGATTVRLSAMLSRETDLGLEAFGGQLVWARVFSLELQATVLDDVSLTRVADDRTGLPALAARSAGVNTIPAAGDPPAAAAIPLPAAPPPVHTPPPPPPAPPAAPVHTPPPAHAPPVHTPIAPYAIAAQTATNHEAPALPARPMRPKDDLEHYPEAGDRVTHFHFGECTVVSSDGDRIRLQQDKDGRVREVALTMLKIDEPTTLPDGKRHFKLGRKH